MLCEINIYDKDGANNHVLSKIFFISFLKYVFVVNLSGVILFQVKNIKKTMQMMSKYMQMSLMKKQKEVPQQRNTFLSGTSKLK